MSPKDPAAPTSPGAASAEPDPRRGQERPVRRPRRTASFFVRLVIPLAAGIFAVAFFRGIEGLPTQSATYPRILIAALLALVAINVLIEARALFLRRPHQPATQTELSDEPSDEFGLRPADLLQPLAVIVLMAVFVVFMPLLGFYLSAIVLMPSVAVVLGVRKLWLIALFTAVLTTGAYLLFEIFLEVPLPPGFLG